MPSPKTKTGTPKPSSRRPAKTRKLSEVTKHLAVPKGIKSSGWPQVEKRCRDLGIEFDDWQQGAGRLILAKTADGKYAATVSGVGMSLPRQIGKTHLIGAIVFALCIDQPGLTVIWTAHHSRTADETFLAMQGFARRRKIAPYIAARGIRLGSGQQEVRFGNGSRILFGARERGFGRGFAGVDILVCDEAQILTDRALDNMLPTMNTAPNALPIFMGTPPTPTDPAEAFRRMRTDALAGDLEDGAWIECGADDDAKHDDRKQWAKANASYPARTPETSMLRLRKKLTGDSWMREGLGVWDQDGAGVLPGWGGLYLEGEPPPVSAIGLSVSLGSLYGSIASADLWPEGAVVGERNLAGAVNLSAVDRKPGTAWMVTEAKRIQDTHHCAVVIDEKCPDGTLVAALEEAGVDLTVMQLNDYVSACSELVNRVRSGEITHQRTAELDEAIEVADWRSVGDGRQVFGRRKSSGPVDMLEAATAAMYGALERGMAPIPAFY